MFLIIDGIGQCSHMILLLPLEIARVLQPGTRLFVLTKFVNRTQLDHLLVVPCFIMNSSFLAFLALKPGGNECAWYAKVLC